MTMKHYEALVILRTAGTEQDLTRHTAGLEEPIKKVGGAVDTTHGLGRRRLAFRIARQTEGHYHLLRFHAPPEQITELERLFHLNETIVRFIILGEDEAGPLTRDGAITSGSPRSMSSAGADRRERW